MSEIELAPLVDAAAFWIEVQAWTALAWNVAGLIAVGAAIVAVLWLCRSINHIKTRKQK